MLTRRTLLISPLLLAAGCTRQTGEGPAAPAGTGPSKQFRVALVTAGSLADSGWNSLAGQGLDRIKAELGAVTSNQNADKSQAEEALRGYARDGYNLVFAHGNEYGDAAKRVGEEFPGTHFAVSSGEVQATNVASLRFDLGEASYLAGMAAAALSKSGKAGQIGGESFTPVKQAFELFEKGGKAVNPKFTTTTTYLGNWSDANAAKEKALSMIRAGADILFQNADAAGQGVFQAAKENSGVLVIGSNANQNDLNPDVIAASAVLDVPKTFLSIAREVQAGQFKGGVYREDLKSGNVYLALNPRFESKIPEAVRAKIRQAEQDIKDGKLNLVAK